MNENILLVEDEEALRMTLRDRLRSEGYVVDLAADGQQGYEKATQLPFDLIILDIMLPRCNGLDICRGIRLAGLATPILLLTARGQTVDKVVGLKLGRMTTSLNHSTPWNLWPASKFCYAGPPPEPAKAFINLAPFASTFALPK